LNRFNWIILIFFMQKIIWGHEVSTVNSNGLMIDKCNIVFV